MNMLRLKEANIEDSRKEWLFIRSIPENENGLTNPYHGISEEEFTETVLPAMIDRSKGIGVPEDRVPDTILYLWDDDVIAGEFRIRHHLNDSLRRKGGHIGYYISPEHRGKGYATKGLEMALATARDIVEEDEILFTVSGDNQASVRVILKNGGHIISEEEGRVYLTIPKRVV